MALLNTLWGGFIIFVIGFVLVHTGNNTYDIKLQKRSIGRFFKTVSKIITRHGIDIGTLGANLTNLSEGRCQNILLDRYTNLRSGLELDPKDIYKCGLKLISHIEKLNRIRKTSLTLKEQDQIEADFCSLVSWISMCNTYDLWIGEFGGGSICAAILKTSGTDPLGILGAKDGDPIRNITY